MPRRPLTPAQQRARAVQLENDTAALHLVRRAAGLKVRATKLAAAGNVTAGATLARATTFRAVAARLVLADRPASLGVPRWMTGGDTATVMPSTVTNQNAGDAPPCPPAPSTANTAASAGS